MEVFLLKLLTDLTSSLVLLYVALMLFKPWIKIAPFICRDVKDPEGEPVE